MAYRSVLTGQPYIIRAGRYRFTPARQLGQENAERAGMWDGAAKEEEESSEESSEEEDEDEESDDSDGMGGTTSGGKTVSFGTSSYADAAPSTSSSGAKAPTVDPTNKFAISAAEADRLENSTLTKREQKRLAAEAEARAKAAAQEKSSDESESSSEEEVPLPKRGGGAGLSKPMKLASLNATTQQSRKEPERKPEPQAMNRRERCVKLRFDRDEKYD